MKFFKREVYSGPKTDKFFEITGALKKAGIKYDVQNYDTGHVAECFASDDMCCVRQ